jgi:hypothetical protein
MVMKTWPELVPPPQHDNPLEGWEDPKIPDIVEIWKIARKAGYAVGVHGSLRRDFDLIATPWTDEAIGKGDLVELLCDGLNAKIIGGPEEKPHGRVGVILQVDGYYKHIDLSIMPIRTQLQYEPETPDTWIKPVMNGYKMQCCDCGLIHELDFQVVKVLERRKNGDLELTYAGPEYEVEFMARRVDL